jgi:polyvinyl alcohol dehydrogenase (cytochrome)
MSPLAQRRVCVLAILGISSVLTAVVSMSGQDSRETSDLANRHADLGARIDSRNVAALKELWMIRTEAPVTHRPLVEGGRAHFADGSGRVYAADLKTGKIAWSKAVETPLKDRLASGFRGTGAIGGGLLFQASAEGNAFAFELQSGGLRWTSRLAPDEPRAGNRGPILYHAGRVYVGLSSMEARPGFRGRVVALDARTGKAAWTLFLAPPSASGAAVLGGFALDPETKTLFFATGGNDADPPTEMSGAMVAVDAGTGKVRWCRRIEENETSDVRGPDHEAGAGPQLFDVQRDGATRKLVGAGRRSGAYVVLERDTGVPAWRFTARGALVADASVGGGRVFLWSDPARVKAVDAETGTPVWSLPHPRAAGGSGAGFLAKDVYFVPSLDGRIRACHADDGRPLWLSPEERSSIGASLAVAGDILLAGRGDGLYAYAPARD